MKKGFYFIAVSIALLVQNVVAQAKEEISFTNAGFSLSGTILFPKGDGPFPAVVFVHGSGPETRSNSQYSAKWFARIGYVAMIYDKRGSGESDGEEEDWNRFDFNILAEDVVAAVRFLAAHKKVEPSMIGLHATSQGGWVAPLAASKTELIRFMIIKSASVCSVGEDRIFERSARLKKEGFSETEIQEATEMQKVEAMTAGKEQEADEFAVLFEKNKDKNWFPRVYPGPSPHTQSLLDYRRWYATIVDFSPVPYLEKLELPVFWIFGDPKLDTQGPVTRSLRTLEMLKTKGKPYSIHSYPGEGHSTNERKYELALYKWLAEMLNYDQFKFKKH